MSKLFSSLCLRNVELANRIVISPMCQYSAVEGSPSDWHWAHLGSLALSGAGLLCIEATAVTPEGRITPGDLGLYSDANEQGLAAVLRMIRAVAPIRVAVQLAHAGRKGSSREPWNGGKLLPQSEGGWRAEAPSAVPHAPDETPPRALERADLARLRAAFASAASRAARLGVDAIELPAAHGYLLHEFLSPVSNRRADEYGGSLENRMRFPLEVFDAVRGAFPSERPVGVRISATDWVAGGIDGDEAVRIAQAFHGAGADIIHVSAGQTTPEARPVYGRMFQTPLSDRIRNEGGVPTIAVGNITEADQVNSIIAAGRADLCALARPHLADPNWTLHAAAQLGYTPQPWPVQYLTGKEQLERVLRRRESELLGTSTV